MALYTDVCDGCQKDFLVEDLIEIDHPDYGPILALCKACHSAEVSQPEKEIS